MAKALKSQSSFLMSRMQTASNDIKETEEQKSINIQEYIERTHKERVELDIGLLDAAPDEMNQFPGLSEEKMAQLKMSIMNSGILVPIIVWAQDNGRYMILAGHNRVEASRQILEEYAGAQHAFDYRKIPAIIYEKDEINQAKAQEIIIDTNYIQRSNLPPKLRVSVIRSRISLMRTQTDEKGATIDKLIDDLGLKKTAIYEDIQIGTQVIPELSNMYFDGKINRKAVLKFPIYDESLQTWIYETYGDHLTSERILRLNKSIKTKAQIGEIFEGEGVEPHVYTQITIPKSKLKAFRKVSTLYLKDAEFEAMCNEYIEQKYANLGD